MPRIPRGQIAGHVYHVLNRGNGGATVFHKDGDYRAFLHLLADAKARYPVKLFGFCLMPNNWTQWLEEPLFEQEPAALRTCVNRQAPFGALPWIDRLAKACGLESTLRPRGRPRVPQTK